MGAIKHCGECKFFKNVDGDGFGFCSLWEESDDNRDDEAYIEFVESDLGKEVTDNTVVNGTTGIFIGSQRTRVLKDILCEGNHIEGCSEESLSMDCFGNNPNLCPVICKTYANKVTYNNNINTSVIELKHLLYIKDTTGKQNYAIIRKPMVDDPRNFLFIVGTGKCAFRYVEVNSFERYMYTDENGNFETLKITVNGNFSKLDPTDECGFYTGFYHCIMRNNTIMRNTREDYGCGISLWGGGYGCIIEGNMFNGLQDGLQCNGFNSYGKWEPAFYNYAIDNKIINNTFINCRQVMNVGNVITFTPQYPHLVDKNTIITGNTIKGKWMNIMVSDRVIFTGNIIEDTAVYTLRLTNSYLDGNILIGKSKFINGKVIGYNNENEIEADLVDAIP